MSIFTAINFVSYIMWSALVLISIIFIIAGIDDIIIDIVYWYMSLKRKWIMRKYDTLSLRDLNSIPEKKLAILVPCWHEHLVIGSMLEHNTHFINYKNYDFFIGVYPNDTETVEVVQELEKKYPNVHCAINKKNGPTNKSDNLNGIYEYIKNHESAHEKYEIFLFHDSEDLIHPWSLKLYNYLIPRKDMIQTPVFPLEISLFNFTHWAYNDEFSENHIKDIVAREAIGGHVPSAGVGTAFSAKAINQLALYHKGPPFSAHSLTEDYSLSLELHRLHLKSIFVLHKIPGIGTRKKYFFFGPPVPKKTYDYICTRSLFPTQYRAAVKQRSRWTLGIALQEWKKSGWEGNLVTKLTLFRDRKSLFFFLFSGVSYVTLFYWISISFFSQFESSLLTLSYFLSGHEWVWTLFLICTFLMLNRMVQRMIATSKVYGLLPAITSPLRIIWGNIINAHAITIAIYQFFFSHLQKKSTVWDKTKNRFPTTHQLSKFHKRLGDLLLARALLTPQQLEQALTLQGEENAHLGEILVRKQVISKEDLLSVLSEQYKMKIVKLDENQLIEESLLEDEVYDFLIQHRAVPIEIKESNVYIAITTPHDKEFLELVEKKCTPLQVHFCLAASEDIQKSISLYNRKKLKAEKEL